MSTSFIISWGFSCPIIDIYAFCRCFWGNVGRIWPLSFKTIDHFTVFSLKMHTHSLKALSPTFALSSSIVLTLSLPPLHYHSFSLIALSPSIIYSLPPSCCLRCFCGLLSPVTVICCCCTLLSSLLLLLPTVAHCCHPSTTAPFDNVVLWRQFPLMTAPFEDGALSRCPLWYNHHICVRPLAWYNLLSWACDNEFGGRAFEDVCQHQGGEGRSKMWREESVLEEDRRDDDDEWMD